MRIDIRQCDDWIAIYKDGVKIDEGHSCSLARGLELLEIEHSYIYLDEINEDDPMEDFPETL